MGLMRDSASPKGELCVFWSRPLEPSRKTGGAWGRSGREVRGRGEICFWGFVHAFPGGSPQEKLGDGRRGTVPVYAGFGEPEGSTKMMNQQHK